MALLVIRVIYLRIPYKEIDGVSRLFVKTSTRLITRDANQSLLSVLHMVTVDQKVQFLENYMLRVRLVPRIYSLCLSAIFHFVQKSLQWHVC